MHLCCVSHYLLFQELIDFHGNIIHTPLLTHFDCVSSQCIRSDSTGKFASSGQVKVHVDYFDKHGPISIPSAAKYLRQSI